MDKKIFKNLKITIINLILIGLFLLVFIGFGAHAFGWFANNDLVDANGMQVIAATSDYDIYIDRTNKYDSKTGGDEDYSGISVFKNKLREEGKTFNTSNTLITSNSLALELDNEFVYRNKYYLVPGAYGSFTMYLKKKVEEEIEATFSFELIGYKRNYDEDYNLYYEIPENDEQYANAIKLIKGHFLFFTECNKSGNTITSYDGFINETNEFTFSTQGKSLCSDAGYEDYYKIVVYWSWPLVYEDILNNTSTAEENKLYPSEVMEYVNNHPDYFFASNVNSDDIEELGEGYNDGDQAIGDNIQYLVVKLNF